jgi:hypothetical protein
MFAWIKTLIQYFVHYDKQKLKFWHFYEFTNFSRKAYCTSNINSCGYEKKNQKFFYN